MVRISAEKKKKLQDEANRRKVLEILMTPGIIIKVRKQSRKNRIKQKNATSKRKKTSTRNKPKARASGRKTSK